MYHSGLSQYQRQKVQNDWMNNDINIVCATTAFGMGVDHPNVRFVFHYTMSMSMDSYIQEVGRAGRDGAESFCNLYFDFKDLKRIRSIISETDEKKGRGLMTLARYCSDVMKCRLLFQLHYIGDSTESTVRCNKCDNCTAADNCYINVNVKEATKIIYSAVNDMCGEEKPKRITLIMMATILKGHQDANIVKKGNLNRNHIVIGVSL